MCVVVLVPHYDLTVHVICYVAGSKPLRLSAAQLPIQYRMLRDKSRDFVAVAEIKRSLPLVISFYLTRISFCYYFCWCFHFFFVLRAHYFVCLYFMLFPAHFSFNWSSLFICYFAVKSSFCYPRSGTTIVCLPVSVLITFCHFKDNNNFTLHVLHLHRGNE